MRKRKTFVWGGVLLCTTLLLMAAAPSAQLNKAAKSTGDVVTPIAPADGVTHWTKANRVQEGVAIQPQTENKLVGDVSEPLPPMQQTYSAVKPAEAKKPMAPVGGTRACADCLTPNTDLGVIGETPWGYSVSGDCSVEGKWYASFTGEAGYTYHWDLCTIGTSAFDSDIKICDASCNILAGVDGSSACGWNADDWTWDCPADGTYYAVIAPYSSYSAHNCTGDALDTFTLVYYKAGACDVICPAGGVAEAETCGTSTNYGCNYPDPNNPVEGFEFINLGADICGTGWFDGSTRDTDWYEVYMPAEGVLNITVNAEFVALFGLIEQTVPGVAGCANTTGYVAPYLYGTECVPTTVTTGCLPAGTYYIFVAPDFADVIPCGVGDEYVLTVTTAPCPTGACCLGDGTCVADQTLPACEAAGGIYWGDGTVCDPNPCPQCCDSTVDTFPFNQDFESGVAPFVDDINDDMNWTWDSGGTSSSATGPSVDHTLGTSAGYYVYTEASGYYPSYMAILNTPCFDLSTLTTPQLRFWYHMYGATMGTLSVEVSGDNCVTWDTLWTASGDHGDVWLLGALDLSAYAGTTIKIRFVGVTGTSYTSDMALDDIWVGEGGVVTGACCQGTSCSLETEEDCTTFGGIYFGDFTDCDPNPCVGACCDAFTQECLGDMSEEDCLAEPNHPDTGWYQYETCATFACPAPYCDICWTDLDDDWITNVTLAEINNTTGPEGAPCSYGDYTDQIAFLVPGGTYTLSVSFESLTYTECVTAWLDFNHDGQWEATERFDLGCGVSTTVTGPITVPMDAVEGPTLMRVTEKYSSAATDACTGGTYGETEDYGLMIGEVDGACCLTDGTCVPALPSDCTAMGGTYGGPFTVCAACDCNFNGVDDFCDILAGTSPDCNANGIPDECDIACGLSQDCNANGIPDECDIAAGTSL
ncbi:MAG: hypothetical protein JXO22_03145, partial [Phycisphaerae bacterium]|nr:hypothetical protein [Phycisphaerae bacterium]